MYIFIDAHLSIPTVCSNLPCFEFLEGNPVPVPLGDSVSHAGEDDKKVECFSLVILLSLQAGRGLHFFIVAKVAGLLSSGRRFNPNGSSLNLLSLVMIPSICLLAAVR